MSGCVRALFDKYNHYVHEKGDPRVAHLFLMDSPVLISVILVAYYLFCTKYGIIVMRNRQPYTLDKLMMGYNVSQILMNSYFIYKALTIVWIPMRYAFVCAMPGDAPVDHVIAQYVYLFFICRLCDLVETIFMIFRKKHKQISFLHVYHHLLVAVCTWMHTKYLPGGHVIIFGTLNSIVHTVMYTYYFITALYPQQKDSIWWKRHITELQLAQFLILAVQQVVALVTPACQYPRVLLVFYLSQALFMIYLFGKFYYRAYLRPAQKKPN